jgi:integration host factor subunit beta
MIIRSELIARICQQQRHLSEKDVSLSIHCILERMSNALASGQRIEIRGFGSYSLRYRKARRAHNPKTGVKLITNPKYAIHFKPGKEMRERIINSMHLPIIHESEEESE